MLTTIVSIYFTEARKVLDAFHAYFSQSSLAPLRRLLPPFTLEKTKADTDWELAQGHAAGEAGVGFLIQIRGV